MDITKSRAGFYLTSESLEFLKKASKELGISRSYYINLLLQNEAQNE